MLFRLLLLVGCFSDFARSEISASSDLNCDFSTSCRWRNSSEGGGQFALQTLVEADAQTRITPRNENDPTPFTYTSGIMGRTLGLLVSEVISCQLGGASIKYWYYKSGQESSLEVCIRQPPGNRDINSMRCYDGVSATFARQWIFRAVELPPIAQPFEIVFKTYFNPPHSIIAIDDINFAATLCESSNGGASEGAGGTFDDFSHTTLADFDGNDVSIDSSHFQPSPVSLPSPPRAVQNAAPTSKKFRSDLTGPRTGPMYKSLCPAIDCNFDGNNFCNYVTSSSKNESNLRRWDLSNRSVLNSLTGVPSDITRAGYFAYAGGLRNQPDDTFIISSANPITLREPGRIDFFVYQAGIRGQFRVCIDDDADCPIVLDGRDIDAEAQKWKNYYFDVPSGEHTFHFIVDGLFDNYVIGLDNIQFLNKFGTGSLTC